MPTTGTVLAKNMALYTGGTPTKITCQVDATFQGQTEMFQTTCKDSGAWASNLPGTKSWTISGTGNLAFDASNGYSTLFTAWTAQTAVEVVFQTAVTGDKKYSGTTYISSLSLASQGNDNAVTFDFELTGTDDIAEATIS